MGRSIELLCVVGAFFSLSFGSGAVADPSPAHGGPTPLLRVVEAIDAPDAVPRVLRSVGAMLVGGAKSEGMPSACVVEDGMLDWTQVRASSCLQELLHLENAFTGTHGLKPLEDGWGGVELGISGVVNNHAGSVQTGSAASGKAVLPAVLGIRLSRVMLASQALDHPVVGHAARRWLKPPGRMSKREQEASPRERRLAALAALLFGEAFCTNADSLASSRALHILSMPADSEDWGGWDPTIRSYRQAQAANSSASPEGTNSASSSIQGAALEAASRQMRQLAWLPPVASRVARRSAAGVLRDMIGPLHRPWQRAGASSLSRLLEPLVQPPASGGVVSCPALDNIATVPSAAAVRASIEASSAVTTADSASPAAVDDELATPPIQPASASREAAERRMVALSWAWSMVESRAFDVSLPGDGDSASAGVEVKVVDPKTRAKERIAAKKKQEAKDRKELQKRVEAAKRGVKLSKPKSKSKSKSNSSKTKSKPKSKSGDTGLRRKGETMLQDNALVPLLDLANTPPPGWMPIPSTPSDSFISQVGVDGEAETSMSDAAARVLQAVAGAALTVEADVPSVMWSPATTGKPAVPRSLVEAGYAGRGRDIAIKGMARAWVVLRVEPWAKTYGPVQGDGEATRDSDTVPVWLAYGGDPRLAEARLLRDTKGKRTTRRAPAAAALGTAGAASDAVSPSGELGELLAGSRCSQEWWVHYGFVPGGHSAAIAAATPELRSAVQASEEATVSLLRKASRVAHAEKVRKRLQDAIAKADDRRSKRGKKRSQKQTAGVSATAMDNNETALAEALVLLDRHRRRVTRSSVDGVWSGAVHPPADCAAVRLRIKHDFNEEDIKSDAEPSKFTMSPHSALLRLTGLLPAMVRDGQPGDFKTPPNRDIVDVTAIVRAPPPQLLASLRTEVAKLLWNDTGITQAAGVAIAAGANINASSLATSSNTTNSSSRALAAAISFRGGSAAPVMDLTSRITLPQRPVAPVPPGLLQAAAALATTREDIEEVGGPLAVASLLEIPVLDSETAKRLGGKKQPRARKRGIRQSKSTRNAIEQQGRRGSHSELRAMRAAIEERGAIAVRGLMESTRDGAVAALRSLAQFPNALTPGAEGAVHDPGIIGLDRIPPPEASLGACVALRLAGFSIKPVASTDETSDTSIEERPAGLGDDRGGLPPDLELLDPHLGSHSLTDAEALLPPDVRAVAHAHASALRALAAATEGAHIEADAAIEEFLAASETEYNPGRKR